MSVGFGVLGARSFIGTEAVMPAIDAADGARLVAVAARSGPVPDRWAALDVGSYEAVLAHPEVDVVYLPLPNGLHAEWTERAADAGRHVLCEKPLAPTADEARRMAQTCATAGVRLFEAWMTPFDPTWRDAVDRAADGTLGAVDTIRSRFTFTIGPDAADNYRWDPSQGGGALLDVGIYALGPVPRLWGTEPDTIQATAEVTLAGVDETTEFVLGWDDGRRLESVVSFVRHEGQELEIVGADGSVSLTGTAHTGARPGTPGDPYRGMIEAVAADISGDAEFPRSIDNAIDTLALLDRIAAVARDGGTT